MKCLRVQLLVLLGLCVFVSPALADKPVSVMLLPGVGVPVGGEWGGKYKSSLFVGADNEIRWTDRWASGGMLGYFFGHTDGKELKREFKNLVINAYAKYYAPPVGSFEFYGLLGAGIYFVNYDDDAAVPDVDDATKRYFGYMAGVGVNRRLAEHWSIGLDCRLHQIFRQQFVLTTLTPALSLKADF